MDAEAGDIIEFNGDVDAFVNAEFDAVASDTLAANIEAILTELNDNTAGWFVYDGDTYVVADTAIADEALVVHLVGAVDLSQSVYNSSAGGQLTII
jgi:hypothetical protein